MNRQGVALIFTLLVLMVLAILSASFFLKTINESNLVKRQVASTQAFWLAEAGVAQVFSNLTSGTLSGNVSRDTFRYNTTTVEVYGNTYQINSAGTVILADASNITRNITVFVTTHPSNASGFTNAIEVNGNLTVRGSVEINGTNVTNASLSFTSKFGLEAEKLRAYAIAHGNNYTDPDPNDIVVNNEIAWVDVTEGRSMITRTGWNGSGILVINGDADITGGNFSGILWVIGALKMSGNPNDFGAIFAECDADINTTVTGNVYIEHNSATIQDALNLTAFVNKTIVSWNEIR
jgi:Tfp pilus assembly protein PilX